MVHFIAETRQVLEKFQCSNYTIGDLINYGHTGAVFNAHDSEGHTVAFKIFNSTKFEKFGSPARHIMLQQEISQQHFPHVVSTSGGGTICVKDKLYYYLVMDKIEGRNLKEYIASEEITSEFVEGLKKILLKTTNQLLEKGFIHCDIKPENIMVANGGDISLIDFDLAKKLGEEDGKDLAINKLEGVLPGADFNLHVGQYSREEYLYVNHMQIHSILYYVLRQKKKIHLRDLILFLNYCVYILPVLNKVWHNKWRTFTYCIRIPAWFFKIVAQKFKITMTEKS